MGRHDSTAERSIVGPRELRPRTWPWGNDPPEDGRLDLTIHSVTKERTTVHRTRCPAGPHRLLVRRRTPPRREAQTGGELVGGRRHLVASSCGAPRPGGPGPRGLSSEKKSKKNVLQVWLTSHGVGARPWTSVGRRSHNRAGFNWLATRALPGPKNASDKYSKAVLRISVITLIRTDTTLAARGHARDASRAGSDAAKRTS